MICCPYHHSIMLPTELSLLLNLSVLVMSSNTLYYDMEQAVAQARSTSLRSSMESQRRSTQMLHYLKCAATDEDDTGFYFLYTEGDVLSVHFFSQNTSKTTYTWRIEAAATSQLYALINRNAHAPLFQPNGLTLWALKGKVDQLK
ncbi:hypothetical protein MUK42_06040 [Musa troglodytarum]|uniref:Uncharacterized protein n=1 Tax=Musa troglodytarum TaxID=320322 RepID=A0A9E7GVF1_9LILI|nr:hypothetical protein MUK42_06040 [Musa troglodytarum]